MSLDDQHEIIVMEDKRPKLTMPESQVSNTANGAVTAPCCIEDSGISSLPPRERTFSFNSARQTAKCQRPRTKRLISRQNTVSGDSSIVQFSRALSRTYTIGSNASSSIPMEEWKPIFDKLDLESDGVADGKIPVDKFKSLLEDDPLWSETVPNDVQVNILDNVDRNQDGVIDYEEFLDLVKGKKFGFGRKRRRAFRELLKETIEFIVPYKYSYQNQYSCSPPPLFMIFMSLLQIAIFTYNSYQIGFVSVNGPVQYCSSLIYNPNKRYQIWRFLTYMVIHSGIFHLVFNVLVQLILGIPLEMVHGKQIIILPSVPIMCIIHYLQVLMYLRRKSYEDNYYFRIFISFMTNSLKNRYSLKIQEESSKNVVSQGSCY